MKISLNWLNDYVSTEGYTPKELADKLLNIGFEVEEIICGGEGIDRVVVGKITDIEKHPDADKLQICSVDIGNEKVIIVTGAKNIKMGDYVPVALDGASLPGGKVIRTSPLRGVMSYGMMCSGEELGIDDSVIEGAQVHGILILPEFKLGMDIKEALGLNDVVFDISVTANRPDCQSVYGIAREVSAVLGRTLKPLNLKYKTVHSSLKPTVKIEDEACGRYTCQVIENVTIKQSPKWMRDRLRSVGIRAINNIVDITNYVLTEVGQPLHAFDTEFVKDIGIIVRRASKGEKITALDKKEYKLTDKMLVISDKDKALAIAGVMGGEHSGINTNTQRVLLESARFAKGSIRATSRMLGLRSDSSARYEKGVDSMSVDIGRERALALIDELGAGSITDAFAHDCVGAVKPKTIVTSAEKISELIGIDIDSSVIVKILESLSFIVQTCGDELAVEVPLFREDVDNYTDLCEEVIRFYGYDNIQSTFMPTAKTTAGGYDTRMRNLKNLKTIVSGLGAYEISTFSFIGKKACDKLNLPADSVLRRQIEILNPLGEEYSVMRTQMAYGMLGAVAFNLNKKNRNFRLFEIGKTYIPQSLPLKKLPKEEDTLVMACVGADENFYTLKSSVMEVLRRFGVEAEKTERGKLPYYHPGMSAEIYRNGKMFCSFGKVHPSVASNFDISDDVYLCEMNLDDFISCEPPQNRFVPLSKYQSVERDIAVIVKDEVAVGDMLKTVKNADELCVAVELFDVYKGEQIEKGYKSVALSFALSASDRTLKDEEINATVNKILEALKDKFGAKLR